MLRLLLPHRLSFALACACMLTSIQLLSGCSQPEAGPGATPTTPTQLNEQFVDPDVAQWVERFEREGREVWDHREAIVEACGLKPGMAVADVGAGTGLFTRLFAPRVGPEGHVYAVDISAKFVAHTESTSREAGFDNVTGVVCTAESTELAPSSVDLAFVCDTYHHFEKPASTLASIHGALRSDGRLIVIDMERVDGESSEWVMNHVRAGKDVFRAEIEAAGFRFVKEEPLMERNYFLVFEKAAD